MEPTSQYMEPGFIGERKHRIGIEPPIGEAQPVAAGLTQCLRAQKKNTVVRSNK